MKIALCIKQVVDISMPAALSPSGRGLVEDNLCYIENPTDECALEEALRIKDKRPDTEIILLSVGPQRVEQALRHCLALGADRAIRIWDTGLADIDSLACARILAKAITSLKVDLIFCGSRSLDLSEGQVPGMLAEFLSLPLITAVTRLELSADASSARLQRRLARGDREIVECSLPALFAFEPMINQPRYPALRRIQWARNCPISCLGLNNLDNGNEKLYIDSLTRLVKLAPPRPRPRRSPILDVLTLDVKLSGEERLKLVLSGGMAEKNGELWQGTPQGLADRLVDFLKAQGYL